MSRARQTRNPVVPLSQPKVKARVERHELRTSGMEFSGRFENIQLWPVTGSHR